MDGVEMEMEYGKQREERSERANGERSCRTESIYSI